MDESFLTLALVLATGLVTGAVAALKIIAPRTKNTTDDKILVYAEDAQKVLEGIGGAGQSGKTVEVKQVR